jgi:hypothetical protein
MGYACLENGGGLQVEGDFEKLCVQFVVNIWLLDDDCWSPCLPRYDGVVWWVITYTWLILATLC